MLRAAVLLQFRMGLRLFSIPACAETLGACYTASSIYRDGLAPASSKYFRAHQLVR